MILGVVFLRASRLVLGGVIGLRLHTAENFWTPQLTRRTASIHHALASVLPEVLILPGTTTVITASRILMTTQHAALKSP